MKFSMFLCVHSSEDNGSFISLNKSQIFDKVSVILESSNQFGELKQVIRRSHLYDVLSKFQIKLYNQAIIANMETNTEKNVQKRRLNDEILAEMTELWKEVEVSDKLTKEKVEEY